MRTGVAILREQALVKGSSASAEMKAVMLKELNDELEAMYAFRAAQKPLALAAGPGAGAVKASSK